MRLPASMRPHQIHVPRKADTRTPVQSRGLTWAVIMLCLSGLSACEKPVDYRVPAARVPVNAPLTNALRKTGDALPKQVTSINCYVPDEDSVSCEVWLTEQAASEMGQRTFEWLYHGGSVTFADKRWDAGPIRNVDLDDMAGSRFQFVVSLSNDGGQLTVYASVDPSSISFPAASTLVSDVMSGIADMVPPILDAVHAATPAAIRDTWSAPGSIPQMGVQGTPGAVSDSQTSAGATKDSNAVASAVGVRRSHGN